MARLAEEWHRCVAVEENDGSGAVETGSEEKEVGLQQIPSGKWYGKVSDKAHAASNSEGKRKERCTPSFATRAEASKALAELKAKVDQEYDAITLPRVEADPLARGLPRAPDDASTAVARKAYWVCNYQTKHFPKRMVVTKSGKQGFRWAVACVYCPVDNASIANTDKRVVATQPSCVAHGGVCKEGKDPASCMSCNLGKQRNNFCSTDCGALLQDKRMLSKAGTGLCAGCDPAGQAKRQKTQAEEAAKTDRPTAPTAPTSKEAAKEAAKRRKIQERLMSEALVLGGYTESFAKGLVPAPGEFVREVYFDYRCALAREFMLGERKYAYVDFVVHTKRGRLVFLETDERQHPTPQYSQLCETTRMWNICESIKLAELEMKVFWLRFNPDWAFKIDGSNRAPERKRRFQQVLKFLDSIESSESDPPMQIGYAFYDCSADHRPLVLNDSDYAENVKPAVVCIQDGSELVQPCEFRSPTA